MGIRKHIRVVGRVQGVGFRWFTRDLAHRFAIAGWVRNCSDGSVEIEAQGQEDRMTLFVNEVKKGPGPGYVRGMQESALPLTAEDDFTIAF